MNINSEKGIIASGMLISLATIFLLLVGIGLNFLIFGDDIDECNLVEKGASTEEVIQLLGSAESIKENIYYFNTSPLESMQSSIVFNSEGLVVSKNCIDGVSF